MKISRLITVIFVLPLIIGATANADLSDGLVAYYPFNGNANDESGNGHNGTVIGATLTTDRLGNPSSAYNFDGDDQIDIPNSPSLEPSVATFSIWFKTSQPSGNWKLISYSNCVCHHGYDFSLFSENAMFSVDHSDLCGYFERVNSNSTLNDGLWHHVAGIHNGSNLSLYVDGVLQDEIRSSNGYSVTGQTVTLGNIGGCDPPGHACIIGCMDEVRIYNRVLSSSEIRELADAPELVPTVSEWGMIVFFILLLGSALWVMRRRKGQESA